MKRSGEPRRGARRVLRAVAIGMGGVAGLCVALGLATLLLLRTERTATWTAQRALARVHVYPGAEIRLSRFRVHPSGWIEARDAALIEADTLQVASFAGIRLHIDWNALRRGEVRADSVRLDSPRVDLVPLLRGLGAGSVPAPSRPERPASARPARIQLASVHVRDGEVRIPLTLRGTPAVVTVRALTVHASQVALAPGAALQLDLLAAEWMLPEQPRPGTLHACGALRGGRATVDSLRLDTATTHLTLHGAAPVQGGLDSLLANLQLDFAAEPLDGADLRPFIAGVPAGARLEGRVHVALQGSRPAQTTGAAGAVLAANWGAHTVPHAQLETTWTQGRAVVQFSAEADGKQAGLKGALRPFDATVPYDFEVRAGGGTATLRGEVTPQRAMWRIDAGQLHHFDLAALVPKAPVSDLTGSLHGNGSGWSPDSLSLDAELRLAGSRFATLPIDSLHTTVAMRTGAVTLKGSGRAHGAAVQFEAAAHPFASEPMLDQARVRFENFDLTRWVQVAKPSTSLDGTLTLSPPGLGARTRRGSAELQLAPSRIGEQVIAGAQLQLSLDGNTIGAEGQLRFPTGGLALEATAQPFAARRKYEVRRFEFTALDLGALLGTPGLRTHLAGAATLEAEGASGDELRAHATLRLDRSTAFGTVLDGAHADAGYEAGAARLVADVDLPGGSGNIEASGRLRDPVPSYRARGHLQSTDLAQLLGRKLPDSQAQVEFDVEGTGFERDAVKARATLTGSGSMGAAHLDSVAARVSIAGDRLHIDSLQVRGNVVHAQAAGDLRLPQLLPAPGDSLHLTARILDPVPLAALLQGHRLAAASGRLSATLRGTGAGASWDAGFDAERVTVDSITAARLQVRGVGTLDADRHALTTQATAALDTLFVADLMLRSAGAAAAYDHETLRISAAGAVDDATKFQVAAHQTVGAGTSVLDTLALHMGSIHWALNHPVQVAHTKDRIQIDDFRLVAGGRHLTVNGVLDRHGEQSLTARADSLRVDVVAGLLGWSRFKGNIDGELQVTGPAAAPRTAGRVALDIRSADSPAVRLDSRFVHEHNVLDVQARLTNPAHDSLVVAGRVPVALPGFPRTAADSVPANAALELRARSSGFDVGSLAMFAPPNLLRALGGRLSVNASVTGSTHTPRLEGDLRLDEGTLQLTSLGAPYSGISVAATLAGDELQIQRLSAHSGHGTLQAHGGLRFGASRAMNLAVTLDRFRAAANRTLRVEATGNVDLTGSLTAPEVRGKLTLTDTDIDVSGDAGNAASQVQLTEADLRMLEENFGYRPRTANGNATAVLDSTLLDVVVEAGRDTWVRRKASPRLALEIGGNVTARKQPGEKLKVFGRLEVLTQRSYAEQLGRRFDVESGAVVMNGDPLQSVIDFVAKWEVPAAGSDNPDATITLRAQGTMNDLRLKFTSDPAMSEMQILSYIATGQPPQGTTGQVQSGSGASSTGTALAFAQASAMAEDVGASLGLDVMQVRNDGVDGATMVAGSYFNSKTYLGVRQSAVFQTQTTEDTSNNASTEVEVEYELLQWLLVNLQGGVSDLRLMFRTRHAY